MKCLKVAGLTVIYVAALSMMSATASATVLTSPPGTGYTGGTLKLSSTHTSVHPGSGTSFLTVTCESAVIQGVLETDGAGVSARTRPLSSLSFTKCGNDLVTVAQTCALEIYSLGGGKGTVTSTGMEVEFHTSEGPTCTMTTKGTDIGVLTGGTPASLSKI